MTTTGSGPGDAARSRLARWALVIAAAAAIIAVAFAIGRFSTFGAGSAATTPTADSADAGFARDMQIHHAQAVEMAMQIYRTTGDDELRMLAYDIATAQSGARGEMYGWLVSWGLSQAGEPMQWMSAAAGHGGHDADLGDPYAAMGMATEDELSALRAATGTDADCLFLTLMTRHHEGAIPMADAVLELGSQPRVREVATGMRATQTAEIAAMDDIRARLGCN